MERGLDQLIFFAFIVLAALVDWVVRVIRNRNAPPRPPVGEPEVEYFEDEAEYPEEDVRPHRSPTPPIQEPAAGEVVFDAPVPAEWRRVIEVRRVPAPERGEAFVMPEFHPPHVVAPHGPPRHLLVQQELLRAAQLDAQRHAVRRTSPRTTAAAPRHGRREALGLKQPDAARRAVVMMAVLGPCRALEDQPRGW